MLRKMNVCLGVGLIATLMSCSSSVVKSDYDRDVNFANYKTYAWMPEPENSGQRSLARNTLFEKRLKSAVDRELKTRAIQKRTESPDFVIAYYVTVKDKIEVASSANYYPGYYGFGYWSRYYGFGYYPRSLDVYQYDEGTLVVDFVDHETMELIWRGTYVGMVDAGGIKAEMVNKAVEHILEQYPPQ